MWTADYSVKEDHERKQKFLKGGKRVTKGGRHIKKNTVLPCQVLVGTYWCVSKAHFFLLVLTTVSAQH